MGNALFFRMYFFVVFTLQLSNQFICLMEILLRNFKC